MAELVHLLTHEFPPFTGGIGVYVQETAAALQRSGFTPTVWAPDYGQAEKNDFPYAVKRIQMRGKQDWLCRLKMGSAVRRAYPDGRIPGTVILAEPGPIRLWMYAKALRLPVPDRLVVILHGSEVLALSRHSRRRARFCQCLLQADRIGVVSKAVKAMLQEVCPGVMDRIVLVSGAVRSGWCDLPAPARKPTSVPTTILQVGRLHPRKGQDVLIDAVSRLPDTLRQQIRLRLIGPPGKLPYRRRLETVIRDQRLPVVLEGPLSEEALQAAYTESILLVMPSQPFQNSVEGLGLALLEAAHFGCAVIGSRLGGIPEAMVDGRSGLLVDPEDPDMLASALNSLLMDPEAISRMGTAGAAFVRQSFSWKRNVADLMDGLFTEA